MKPIYGEGFISDRDIFIVVTSNIMGVIPLTLPRVIAQHTISADGWLAILIGGGIASLFAWVVAKLASSFPNQSFYSFASYLVTKPVAVIITLLFSLQYFMVTCFQIREISALAHQYLFDQTPIEVVSLSFLLVVVYAVAGSRAGIFRLNVLFFPIVMGGLLILILLPLGFIDVENFLPVFQTDFQGYLKATYSSVNTFMGFGIVLFYIALVKNPKGAPKMTVLGILSAMIFCFFLFIVCIGTFGNSTTSNLFFPIFDLSRAVEIPGGFFERFDAFLFVIWTVNVFTTCLLAFDIVVMTITMVFTKVKKMNVIFALSPTIFFISMLPKNYLELIQIGKYLPPFILIHLIIVTMMLGIAYKLKGGNQIE